LILLSFVPSQSGTAWSKGGHHLIVAVAFNLLADKEKSELSVVLKQHPRFAEEFVPSEKHPNDNKRTRWLVRRSAYWPDLASKLSAYLGHQQRRFSCFGEVDEEDSIHVPKRQAACNAVAYFQGNQR
jgi:hypothetical protein